MATALPVTKFVGLLVKTLAKPLSKRIQHEFSRSQPTRGFLVAIGRVTHNITSRLTIWSAGYRVRTIEKLPKDKAIQQGAEFVGESFILAVSMGTVFYEYQRSAEKELRKLEQQRNLAAAERHELQQKLVSLDLRLQALEKTVETNKASIFSYLSSSYVPPPSEKLVPIVDTAETETNTAHDGEQKTIPEDRVGGETVPKEPESAAAEQVSTGTKAEESPSDQSSGDKQHRRASWWWPF